MALMQLTIIPLGTDSPGIGEFVAEIQNFLQQQGAIFKLNDMGTTIEGDTVELLTLAAKLHELPFQKGIKRVITQITIDDRRDKKVSLGNKMASIKNRLAGILKN